MAQIYEILFISAIFQSVFLEILPLTSQKLIETAPYSNQKYKVKEIQVEMKEREAGVSYFHNPFKSIYYMMSVALSIIFLQ